MKRIKIKNFKTIALVVDKHLNQYDNQPIFEKKINQVNELIEGVTLPKIPNKQKS